MVKVDGVIDPAQAAYVRGSIERSKRVGATVILQVDSRGGYGDEGVRLGRFIRSAAVPVVSWVGPSGARAAGGALFLLYGSSLAAMAPGAGIGPARPFDLDTSASREDPGPVATRGMLFGEPSKAAAGADSAATSGSRVPAFPSKTSNSCKKWKTRPTFARQRKPSRKKAASRLRNSRNAWG